MNLYEKMIVNVWYHLVYVLDETSYKVYVDGSLIH